MTDYEYYRRLHDLISKGEQFVTATVVQTEGSSSAKVGAKAVIGSEGQNLYGWVGGGCAESAVADTAIECLNDGKARLIDIDMTDEIMGVGMPCGGKMKIYVEPQIPPPHLLIEGHGLIAESLANLAHLLEFKVTVDDPSATPDQFPHADNVVSLEPSQLSISPDTFVVVATQHKSDDKILKSISKFKPAYVGLIASKTRTQIVLNDLRAGGVPISFIDKIRAPAGVDINSRTPQEIALSVLAEIVKVKNARFAERRERSYSNEKLKESVAVRNPLEKT